MSTRSRKSTSSHASTSRQSIHQVNETPEAPTSPLTPSKVSRLEEKAILQQLNDRLAAYIERVRELETENSKLTLHIESIEEKNTREVQSQKGLYDQEITEIRRVLDETAQEKAKLQIEATTRKAELDELKQNLAKKERDYNALDSRMGNLETSNHDLHSRLSQLSSEKKKLEDALKNAHGEVDKLKKQLESAKKQLEEETLIRVGLENKVLTLNDQLKFLNECHHKEITETKRVAHMEKTDIDHKLKDYYEEKMRDTLRELRESHDEQMRLSRQEIEEKYQNLQDELQRKIETLSSSSSATTDEMWMYKSRADNMESQVHDLQSQLDSLRGRNKDLEKLLEQEREWHRSALRNKDNEIRQLNERLNRQLKDFHDAMDTNVAINSELAVYEKLLESEECRLNLSETSKMSTPGRRIAVPRKRKRVVHTEEEESQKEQCSSSGVLEISDQDPQGKFIKIRNNSEQETPLGGYVLVREAGNDHTCKYKFTRHMTIKPNSVITVWSHNSGKSHNPSSGDLVMKSGQNWPAGPAVSTSLMNPAGEEVASRNMAKRSHTSRQDAASDDLLLMEGMEQTNGDAMQERCCLM